MTTELEKRAREFAIKHHADQKYGDQSYIEHLDEVHGILSFKTECPRLLAAAYLHDVIEDTEVTRDQLVKEFGFYISSLVEDVTKYGNGNRALKTFRNLRALRQHQTKSILLKLCDRLANFRSSKAEYKKGNKRYLKMYVAEHGVFSAMLRDYEPELTKYLWIEMDEIVRFYYTSEALTRSTQR